jgi:hypothetical protein
MTGRGSRGAASAARVLGPRESRGREGRGIEPPLLAGQRHQGKLLEQ